MADQYYIERTRENGYYDRSYLRIDPDNGELIWEEEGPNDEGQAKAKADRVDLHTAWLIVRHLRMEQRIATDKPEYEISFAKDRR